MRSRSGFKTLFLRKFIGAAVFRHINRASGQQLRIAGIFNPVLAQHLPHDNLNVLVVDLNAVIFIDFENLCDDVFLDTAGTLYFHDVVRVDGAVREEVAGFNNITGIDDKRRRNRNGIRLRLAVFRRHGDFTTTLLRLDDLNRPAYLGDNRLTFRLSRFKQLFNARETLCDVTARRDTACGTYAWSLRSATDRLRSHDADSL